MRSAIRLFCASVVVVTSLIFWTESVADEHEASDPPVFSIDYLLGIGFMAGGDTIATYTVTYPPSTPWIGGETVDDDVKGGRGGYFFVGGAARWPRYHVALELHWGLFKDTSIGGSGRFSRLATELILFTELNQWRLGAGFMHHGSPEFKDDNLGNLEFEDAEGWLVQLEYVFEGASLGLRHGSIDYKRGDSTLNGDHWGLIGALRFGR